MFSSAHFWNDGRIYHRQVKTLEEMGFDVELHGVADSRHKVPEGKSIFGLPPWHGTKDRIKNILILLRRAMQSRASVFHFHDPELLLIAPIIKIIKRKTLIYDVHEHYPLMIKDKTYLPSWIRNITALIFQFYERISLIFIDYVFFATDNIGKRYVRIKDIKAVSVRNVPRRTLFPAKPLPIPERSKTAIFLGYITEITGLREVIKAFKIVHEIVPDYKLFIVGKIVIPDFEKEIRKLVSDLKLEKSILFKGEVPYIDLQNILKEVRIGYITYLSYPNNMAGLPNKMFEYMGAGINIIASDFDNYKAVIVNNNCGIVVEPENVQAIADATLKYINDDKFAEEIAENARKAFLLKYNWEIESVNLINVYKSLE